MNKLSSFEIHLKGRREQAAMVLTSANDALFGSKTACTNSFHDTWASSPIQVLLGLFDCVLRHLGGCW
jgi:hypothetical protein